MFEKLSRVEERYNKIAADLCDPAVVCSTYQSQFA